MDYPSHEEEFRPYGSLIRGCYSCSNESSLANYRQFSLDIMMCLVEIRGRKNVHLNLGTLTIKDSESKYYRSKFVGAVNFLHLLFLAIFGANENVYRTQHSELVCIEFASILLDL